MAAYKYYRWERVEYMDLFNIPISACNAESIHKKIANHYKIWFKENGKKIFPGLELKPSYSIGKGQAYGSKRIVIGVKTNLGVLVHEWAHIVNYWNGGHNHGRSFKRWHKKLVTWVRARYYFGLLDKMLLNTASGDVK
jgi:hypothetical protein